MTNKVEVVDGVYLAANAGGEIVLCIGALAYGEPDKIPAGLLAKNRLPGGDSAGYFVEQMLLRNVGPDRSAWPEAAARFLDKRPVPQGSQRP